MSGTLGRLRQMASRNPRSLLEDAFRITKRSAIRTYFSTVTPDGCDVMSEAWNQLIILDGCRFDTFRKCNTIEGRLDRRRSKAARTPEFLDRNFAGMRYPDTVYVTANPMHRADRWCDVDLDRVFHEVVDVWATEWDEELNTVLPEKMAKATLRARNRFPEYRLIAHFVQPHYPFIGPLGQELEHTGIGTKDVVEKGLDTEKGIWEALEDGEFSVEEVRAAYEENLELTLPHVDELIEVFDGTTVVTSDHGNHFGERALPFPTRLYGHPGDFRTPELVEVPWLVAKGP